MSGKLRAPPHRRGALSFGRCDLAPRAPTAATTTTLARTSGGAPGGERGGLVVVVLRQRAALRGAGRRPRRLAVREEPRRPCRDHQRAATSKFTSPTSHRIASPREQRMDGWMDALSLACEPLRDRCEARRRRRRCEARTGRVAVALGRGALGLHALRDLRARGGAAGGGVAAGEVDVGEEHQQRGRAAILARRRRQQRGLALRDDARAARRGPRQPIYQHRRRRVREKRAARGDGEGDRHDQQQQLLQKLREGRHAVRSCGGRREARERGLFGGVAGASAACCVASSRDGARAPRDR
eukprot:scaffold5394_cov274-Prasinococcus_capsulatus_cf.AAC.2